MTTAGTVVTRDTHSLNRGLVSSEYVKNSPYPFCGQVGYFFVSKIATTTTISEMIREEKEIISVSAS